HLGTGPGEAPHAAHKAGKRGEGGAGGQAPVKRGPPARPDATTAVASTAYLLDHLAKILSIDRSKEIAEAVAILTSAKKLFVYGVGRSGLAARAFAMRMVQLGIDCYFIGETITPVVGDGDAVLIVSNTGSTMSAIQVANIARRVVAVVVLGIVAYVASRFLSTDLFTLYQLFLVFLGVGYVFASILSWTGFGNLYRYSPTLFIGSPSYRKAIAKGDIRKEGRDRESL